MERKFWNRCAFGFALVSFTFCFHGALAVDNVYILMLGTSGCGKSSTINFLLNKTIAGVGHSNSATSAIHEYSVQLSSGNVTIIDTPGFGDTRGLQHDARFIATLQQYLETRADLSKRAPDIVLLCHRYDENRFSGQQSLFVKMLRGVGLVADLWFSPSNTAILLTHAGAELDSHNRIPMYRQTLENYTQFPGSLTFLLGENKLNLLHVDSEEESSQDQQQPLLRKPTSGDWYPDNMCKWMQSALGNQARASMVAKLCALDYISVQETEQFNLLEIHDTKPAEAVRILTKLELQIEDTVVSRQISKAFVDLSEQGYNFTQDTTPYLQKALNLLHIFDLEDVPWTNIQISRLFRSLRSGNGIVRLLHTAFQIEPPELPSGANLMTGFGYDKTKAMGLSTTIFPMDIFEPFSHSIGYKIPAVVHCSYDSTVAHRQFSNLRIQKSCDNSPCHGVVTLEFQFMHCQVAQAPPIAPEYETAAQSMGKFNRLDHSSIWKWKAFVEKYGTHVVKESYLGGMIRLSGLPGSWKLLQVPELLTNLQTDGFELTKRVRMQMSGGSHVYHTNSPKHFFSGPTYQTWLKSIEDVQVSLPTDLQLEPMENYLGFSQNFTNEFVAAREYFADSQTNPSETLQNELLTCEQDKNATLQQNFDIAQKFMESQNKAREIQIKLTASELEIGRMGSEIESHKLLLEEARAANTAERAHSQELNQMLQQCDSLSAGCNIARGQTLDRGYTCRVSHRRLIWQNDGNLVIYDSRDRALWSSGTDDRGSKIIHQLDGNLVIYGTGGRALWATNTQGVGAKLVFQSDGNFVMYNSAGAAAWSTGTVIR